MTLNDPFVILTWISFLFILIFYVCYFFVLQYYHKKALSTNSQIGFSYPFISLLIPVYNEEKIIAKKIKNIEELIYPKDKMEVLFIDGKSTDETSNIIRDSARISKTSIQVIKQEKRDGYSRAIIQGILNSKGEIIVATDGASFHYSDALQYLVRHFKNSEIGAVTGKEIVLGGSSDIGPEMEKSYRSFYDFMRKAESEMDSTPDAKGEILAVRKEICVALIEKLKLPTASFDSCVPYQAKMMGYRTIYDEEAKYYEYAPTSFSDRMTVAARRATVLMGALILFKNLIFNKKSGKFGLIILPIHFVMYFIIPSIFLVGSISLFFSTLLDPLATIIFWLIALIFVIYKKSRIFLISFVQSQFALFIAIFRLIRRKNSLIIDSVSSTRDNV